MARWFYSIVDGVSKRTAEPDFVRLSSQGSIPLSSKEVPLHWVGARTGRLQCLAALRIATLGGGRRPFAAAGMNWTGSVHARHWLAVGVISG